MKENDKSIRDWTSDRVLPNHEKKKANMSISIEESLAYKFKRYCYEKRTTASREIREFIIKCLSKSTKNEE